MSVDIMDYCTDEYKNVKADKLIGIFGNPIKHTLSPIIHDTLSNIVGLSERYVPFCVKENELDFCMKRAYEEGILGLNITVPHKQEVIKSLVDVDCIAQDIGAVNTLVRSEKGYKGYNTDMPGLAKALESENIVLNGSRVIMLGAGGAARAVAYMCAYYGAAEVYIINRTYQRAADIASDMNRIFKRDVVYALEASEYKKIPKNKYLMIQCTSVGLHEGDGLPFDFDDEIYGMAYAGVDLIYNPAKTPFLYKMCELGVPAINGLKMLLYQGILAFELWNDIKISDTAADIVYLALKDALYGVKRKDNIVLIGYMGAGKSTVGKALAVKKGYSFIDTDMYIEEREGMTISEIFKVKGEDYFRRLETEILTELKDTLDHAVLATGGGLPLRSENSELLKQIGTVYYLKADADTIYERVKASTDRPLLQCDNPYKRICDMLEVRNPIYEKVCDIRLKTDGCMLEDIIKYME